MESFPVTFWIDQNLWTELSNLWNLWKPKLAALRVFSFLKNSSKKFYSWFSLENRGTYWSQILRVWPKHAEFKQLNKGVIYSLFWLGVWQNSLFTCYSSMYIEDMEMMINVIWTAFLKAPVEMERREISSDMESKCEQVCLELLLKAGDVMYFPEVFRKWIPEPALGDVMEKKPVPVTLCSWVIESFPLGLLLRWWLWSLLNHRLRQRTFAERFPLSQ